MSSSRRKGSGDAAGPRSRISAENRSEDRLTRDGSTNGDVSRGGSLWSGSLWSGSLWSGSLWGDSPRKFVAATCILTLAFFVWQVVWTVLTPAFRAPDEPLHVNSVVRVAQGQGWPDPGEARVSSSVVQAVRESGLISADSESFGALERTRVVGSRESYPRIPLFGDTPVTPHPERITMSTVDAVEAADGASGAPGRGSSGDGGVVGERDGASGRGTPGDGGVAGNTSTEIVDQMTQHPPLFYELQAAVFRAVGAGDWPWDRQLLLMRIVSALMTLPLVPCSVFATRRAGASRRMALAAGVLAFAVPQLAYVTASLNNDALAIGAGALCMAAVSAAIFGSGGWRTVGAAGLALGLGLWSKGTFIPMGLTVGLAFLVNVSGLTWRQRLVRAVSAGGIGVLTGGFWWVRNLVLFGVLQPAGYQSRFFSPGTDIAHFFEVAFRNLTESFWGRFDWMDWPLAAPLVWTLTVVAIVMVLVAVISGPHRTQRLVLLSFFVFVTGLLVAQAWTQYRDGGIVPGTQGRYLFPGIVGLLALWALGLERLGNWGARIDPVPSCSSRGSALSRLAPLLVTIPAVLIAAYSALTWARACYPMPAGSGGIADSNDLAQTSASGVLERLGAVVAVDMDRWSLVAGLGAGPLTAVVVLGACALLVAAVTPLAVSTPARLPQRIEENGKG